MSTTQWISDPVRLVDVKIEFVVQEYKNSKTDEISMLLTDDGRTLIRSLLLRVSNLFHNNLVYEHVTASDIYYHNFEIRIEGSRSCVKSLSIALKEIEFSKMIRQFRRIIEEVCGRNQIPENLQHLLPFLSSYTNFKENEAFVIRHPSIICRGDFHSVINRLSFLLYARRDRVKIHNLIRTRDQLKRWVFKIIELRHINKKYELLQNVWKASMGLKLQASTMDPGKLLHFNSHCGFLTFARELYLHAMENQNKKSKQKSIDLCPMVYEGINLAYPSYIPELVRLMTTKENWKKTWILGDGGIWT